MRSDSPAVASRSCLRPFIFVAVISALWTLACYLAAGASLGIFWGGFFGVTILAPAVATSQEQRRRAIICVFSPAVGAAAVWLIAVFQTADTMAQWAQLSLTISIYALAMGGLARFGNRIGLNASLATSFVILLGLAWLSWPIWFAAQITRLGLENISQSMVNMQPLLVANGVLTAESPWTQKTFAYQLTNLNQDVPIQLPASEIQCLAICALISAATWAWREKAAD